MADFGLHGCVFLVLLVVFGIEWLAVLVLRGFDYVFGVCDLLWVALGWLL